MAIFAIGDMHLSLGTDKPMDVFPGWEGYLPRLEASWRKLIGPDTKKRPAGRFFMVHRGIPGKAALIFKKK